MLLTRNWFSSGRPLELQTTLYPSTADDANQQYVCLQLYLKFPPKYPEEKPLVELRNPRGLGDDFLANALKQCHEKCSCFSGSPVIYELIEVTVQRVAAHCSSLLKEYLCLLTATSWMPDQQQLTNWPLHDMPVWFPPRGCVHVYSLLPPFPFSLPL